MNRIERTQELVRLLETRQTLSDGEFYELFDLLEDAGADSAGRHVQICDAIPAAKCTPEEEVLYAAARTRTTAETTASIAESAEATQKWSATGLVRSRSFNAASKAMHWDFGPLSCRAEKTCGFQMT